MRTRPNLISDALRKPKMIMGLIFMKLPLSRKDLPALKSPVFGTCPETSMGIRCRAWLSVRFTLSEWPRGSGALARRFESQCSHNRQRAEGPRHFSADTLKVTTH